MKTIKLHGGKLAHMASLSVVAILVCGAVLLAASEPARLQEEVPAPAPLRITTTTLPDAKVGAIYDFEVFTEGGKLPHDFSATGLPDGLSIRNFSDRISGKATVAGDFSPVISVSDSSQPKPMTASATLKLKVLPAN